MTWEEAVKTMGKWFHDNIHSYWQGGGHRGENSSANPLFVSQGNPRASFKCNILNRNVQNDCTAFVGACCQLFKPDIFPSGFAPGSAMFADPNGSTAAKMKAAGFQQIPWSKDAMQPGDIILGHFQFGGNCHHGEIYAGNGKAYSWGSVHDGRSYPGLSARNMPGGWSAKTYNLIYRFPGGWTGQVADAGVSVAGGGFYGDASGGYGVAMNAWAGDFDQAAAAADASRGVKLFSRGSAQQNILSLLLTGKDSSSLSDDKLFKTPPRIWQYLEPEIVMPTISFPVNPFEEDAPIWDDETQSMVQKKVQEKLKKAEEEQKKAEKGKESDPKKIASNENESTKESGKKSENGTDIKEEYKRGTGEQAKETHEKWIEGENKSGYEVKNSNYAVEADLKKDLGRSFPIVYINDHMFSEDELEYLKLDCNDFLPTIELHVTSRSKTIIKENLPKEGDTIGLFIQYTHTMIRPLRCDFIITAAISKNVSQEFLQDYMSMIVYGELKIPDIYNSDIAFEYQGSSRNALVDIAQKLKLGYCFNDPDDTNDAQSWYCTPEQSGDPKQYIEDLALHLYKDTSSFYNAWIDPRYNLTVINIRDMLGITADCDDGIDLTKMVSVINNNYFDGNKQDKNQSVVTPKIFNNFLGNQSMDTYYVYDYKLINQASEISNKMGLLQHSNFGINATGLPASLTIEINPQLCLNWEKVEGVTSKGEILDARYIVMSGPGINRNQNDNPPENGSYVESRTKTSAATDINVQSDEEQSAAKEAASNQINIISQNVNINELPEVVIVGKANPKKSVLDEYVGKLNKQLETPPPIKINNIGQISLESNSLNNSNTLENLENEVDVNLFNGIDTWFTESNSWWKGEDEVDLEID